MDTLSSETPLLKLILTPPEKGPILKGKNLLPCGANSFLFELTHFPKGPVCSTANRMSQKLSSWVKMTENLPGPSCSKLTTS